MRQTQNEPAGLQARTECCTRPGTKSVDSPARSQLSAQEPTDLGVCAGTSVRERWLQTACMCEGRPGGAEKGVE